MAQYYEYADEAGTRCCCTSSRALQKSHPGWPKITTCREHFGGPWRSGRLPPGPQVADRGPQEIWVSFHKDPNATYAGTR